ncbi:hypothetical protein G9E11_01970 [Arthrobacter sp. IA7]|uniref:hypothetical protein n=1 Tax=Arthrobacter ipis TaxID=2716202 RepID=UPI001687F153|nr:hypothetical protein [Arthrobacter ipis]MBD1541041.1 hypothetical protein [Arthrobacter ipis]
MSTNAIKRPATLRELGDMAGDFPTFMRMLDELGPWPIPPVGFAMTKGSEQRWIGNDVVNRQYIVTPVWNAATNSRSIDLWTSKEPGESDTHLMPLQAIELAADLLIMAKDALGTAVEEDKDGN